MLAIGLVVDDAIIVVEAVEHHIDEGLDPKAATEKAMEEVGGPVVAIALILAAVFIPTAAIPGITGRLYQQFAVTIAISVLISAFNALTLSPALAALLLKPRDEARKKSLLSRAFGLFNRIFGRATDSFIGTSRILIHKSAFAMLGLVLVAILAVYLGGTLPGGFIPTEDQGYMFLALQLPDSASAQRTDAAEQKISDALLKTPGVEGVIAVTISRSLTQVQSTNAGFFFVNLKPVGAPKDEGAAARIHSKPLAAATRCKSRRHRVCIPAAINTRHWNFRRCDDDPGRSFGIGLIQRHLTKSVFAFLGASQNGRRSQRPFPLINRPSRSSMLT